MAAGKPVVAFGAGGATETVVDGKTGVLFRDQTPLALSEAIERLDEMSFDPVQIRLNAERFGRPAFHRRIASLFDRLGVPPEAYAIAAGNHINA
jgi:glycosyltransferase involved in cell wall biosynthesis